MALILLSSFAFSEGNSQSLPNGLTSSFDSETGITSFSQNGREVVKLPKDVKLDIAKDGKMIIVDNRQYSDTEKNPVVLNLDKTKSEITYKGNGLVKLNEQTRIRGYNQEITFSSSQNGVTIKQPNEGIYQIQTKANGNTLQAITAYSKKDSILTVKNNPDGTLSITDAKNLDSLRINDFNNKITSVAASGDGTLSLTTNQNGGLGSATSTNGLAISTQSRSLRLDGRSSFAENANLPANTQNLDSFATTTPDNKINAFGKVSYEGSDGQFYKSYGQNLAKINPNNINDLELPAGDNKLANVQWGSKESSFRIDELGNLKTYGNRLSNPEGIAIYSTSDKKSLASTKNPNSNSPIDIFLRDKPLPQEIIMNTPQNQPNVEWPKSDLVVADGKSTEKTMIYAIQEPTKKQLFSSEGKDYVDVFGLSSKSNEELLKEFKESASLNKRIAAKIAETQLKTAWQRSYTPEGIAEFNAANSISGFFSATVRQLPNTFLPILPGYVEQETNPLGNVNPVNVILSLPVLGTVRPVRAFVAEAVARAEESLIIPTRTVAQTAAREATAEAAAQTFKEVPLQGSANDAVKQVARNIPTKEGYLYYARGVGPTEGGDAIFGINTRTQGLTSQGALSGSERPVFGLNIEGQTGINSDILADPIIDLMRTYSLRGGRDEGRAFLIFASDKPLPQYTGTLTGSSTLQEIYGGKTNIGLLPNDNQGIHLVGLIPDAPMSTATYEGEKAAALIRAAEPELQQSAQASVRKTIESAPNTGINIRRTTVEGIETKKIFSDRGQVQGTIPVKTVSTLDTKAKIDSIVTNVLEDGTGAKAVIYVPNDAPSVVNNGKNVLFWNGARENVHHADVARTLVYENDPLFRTKWEDLTPNNPELITHERFEGVTNNNGYNKVFGFQLKKIELPDGTSMITAVRDSGVDAIRIAKSNPATGGTPIRKEQFNAAIEIMQKELDKANRALGIAESKLPKVNANLEEYPVYFKFLLLILMRI